MKKRYYGNQTSKAVLNFPFSYPLVQRELIYALSEIKEAATLTHYKNGVLPQMVTKAIVAACKEIRKGIYDDQFPLSALQGGAGTSINMNVNEVIASRAQELVERENTSFLIHPNDHVNRGQSTNDVNPSALKIASIRLVTELLKTVDILIQNLGEKAKEFVHVRKLGRTHLQDAVPTTLGEEFTSYRETVKRAKRRIEESMHFFSEINLGGTAIGNGINASHAYRERVYDELRNITGLPLQPASNCMSQTNSQSDFLMLSQLLVTLTLDLSKIASDLRILSSGPRGGIGEIRLPELQHGSSIMPGKVNPVLPEVINQLYFLVTGNNVSIEQCAAAAQLELGVMFPLLADRLLSSLKITQEVIKQFATVCIPFIEVDKKRCTEHLENSTAYATLLTPVLGYDVVSDAVHRAQTKNKTLRQVILERHLLSEDEFELLIMYPFQNVGNTSPAQSTSSNSRKIKQITL